MKEPSRIKMSLKCAVAVLWLLCISSLALSVQTSGNRGQDGDAKMDYAAAKQEIRSFESSLNEALQSFIRDFLGIKDNPRGAYLPGYGANFTFAIDIKRAIFKTPFGDVSRHQATEEQKRQRVEELKDLLIRLLQAEGRKFQQLGKGDCVTIVAFIDDKNFFEPSANKTIVLRAQKKDLDELGNRSDRLNDFKQRIKIVEY
jgi:hypothetical protein